MPSSAQREQLCFPGFAALEPGEEAGRRGTITWVLPCRGACGLERVSGTPFLSPYPFFRQRHRGQERRRNF